MVFRVVRDRSTERATCRLLHRRLDAAARPARAGRRPRRPARAAHAGRPSGRLRRLLRGDDDARRALPAAERTARCCRRSASGRKAEADAATAPGPRASTRRVRGTLREPAGRFPAGTPWRADDPELLLWIIATLVDSNLLVYQRYVGPLTARRAGGLLAGLPAARQAVRPRRTRTRRATSTPSSLHGRHARAPATCGSATRRASSPSTSSCARRCRSSSGRCSSSPTRSRSACCPPASAGSTASRWDPVRGLAVRGGAEYLRRVVVPLLPDRWRIAPSAAPPPSGRSVSRAMRAATRAKAGPPRRTHARALGLAAVEQPRGGLGGAHERRVVGQPAGGAQADGTRGELARSRCGGRGGPARPGRRRRAR